MSALRAVLVAVLVWLLATTPTLIGGSIPSWAGTPTYAAVGSSPLAQDNDNDDDDDDDNDDDDDDDDNDDDDDDNDDDDDDNDDDDDGAPSRPAAAAAPPPPPAVASACISGGQNVTLDFPGGASAITNVVGQAVNVRLERVNPAQGPAGLLDDLVFNMVVEACGGGPVERGPDVNLGIRYTVGANKANLRIVRLEGGQWTESGITTVPDPNANNPYISATIPGQTRSYAVVQR
jgi:hypothetical protein